ncbi:IclR family transcriptional regulator [Rhodococcus aetherivorans]|uniref:IclR family transcriptional regulator n=1 Tax=Rhodococcus aetherivorans TaxID=191292 RepID=UPI0038910E20
MTEAAATSSARRSPPTDRVVQVLDHLVAHPETRFGLSELARRLGMSKPTCLGILTALTEAGYLMRHPADRTYGLGPALIVAGRAAQRGFAVGPVTHRHLAALGAEFGATCAASAVVGDRIAVLDVAGADPDGAGARVGEVYPFAPPVGLMYVLWDSDERLEQWLAREPTLPVRLDRDRLRDVVDECRTAGYLVESLTAGGRRLHALMAGVAAHDLPSELRELLGEMVSSLGERVLLTGAEPANAEHPVNLLAAPAYDADGRQSVVLTLHVGATLANREIARRGAALVATAEAVTRELGGRRPAR